MSEVIGLAAQRKQLVERQIKGRGVRDPAVLAAVEAVPREAFLPPELAEFAYLDRALPIEKGQTISQPYIVALMTEALSLKPTDRVLEVGTGSGYAAAILGKVAQDVYTIERHAELAETAARRLREQGFDNVHVQHGDGTLGWQEHAPFDAIVVAAGGPEVPQALLDQLAIGGRLVIPVGEEKTLQSLLRVTRTSRDNYEREDLGDVRFVPLVGAGGWEEEDEAQRIVTPRRHATAQELVSELVRETAEPLAEIEGADLAPLVERVGRWPSGFDWRGHARHVRILSHALRDHQTIDRTPRLSVRGHRGRLARRGADRSVRAPTRSGERSPLGSVLALPDLDVAQSRSAGVCRMAAHA